MIGRRAVIESDEELGFITNAEISKLPRGGSRKIWRRIQTDNSQQAQDCVIFQDRDRNMVKNMKANAEQNTVERRSLSGYAKIAWSYFCITVIENGLCVYSDCYFLFTVI